MRQLLPLIAAAAAVLTSCGDDAASVSDASLLHEVTRGDLVISVRERAEIQAASDTRVTSQLEGRATLIHLIPEGSVVKKGDKVAELDASAIEEKRATQAIALAKVGAALEQARKNIEIMEKELRAAENTAKSRLQIARMRVEKFLGETRQAADADTSGTPVSGTNRDLVAKLGQLIVDESKDDPTIETKYLSLVDRLVQLLRTDDNLDLAMGEMANQVLLQVDAISLARADLELAKDTLGHSRKLSERGFITKNELDRDEINYRRQLSKVTVAWNNLQLLIKFTLPETLITLEQEVENAQLGLESVKGTNDARRVKEAAGLKSAEAEYDLAKERLDNWDEQIRNAVIYAPTPGLVVYGRWDWDEPVYEGMDVRERQEIVVLPNVQTMIAELKVHEAQIDKVAPGQRASIEVDAFPERTFGGQVSRVSSLPDPNPRNRDLKVFRVKVLLDVDNSDGTLRPGMNSTVTIRVGTLRDVLQVPQPALERSGDTHYVWKSTPNGPVATKVVLGGNNLTHVEVVAGLSEGDRIYLVRPAGAQLPAPAEPDRSAEATPAVEAALPSADTTGVAPASSSGNGG